MPYGFGPFLFLLARGPVPDVHIYIYIYIYISAGPLWATRLRRDVYSFKVYSIKVCSLQFYSLIVLQSF